MNIKTTRLNKEEQRYQRMYAMSGDYCLADAYGRYSKAKADAWKYCEEKRDKYEGWGLKVLSHNSFMFTAGFEFENPETGAIALCIITPSKDFAFEEGAYDEEVK